MPYLTSLPHSNSESTEWALKNPNDDWKTYRARYETAYLSHTDGSEADWQAHKHTLGRGSTRAARTMFSFYLLLGLTGIVDIFKRRLRRGTTSLVLAVTTGLMLYAIWYSREGHYVKEMVSASSLLPESTRPRPSEVGAQGPVSPGRSTI